MKKTKLKVIWPNKFETYAFEGDNWFAIAKKAGFDIPSGCLTGSCGACELDINGSTVRSCISDVKIDSTNILKVDLTSDPFW